MSNINYHESTYIPPYMTPKLGAFYGGLFRKQLINHQKSLALCSETYGGLLMKTTMISTFDLYTICYGAFHSEVIWNNYWFM